MISQIERKDVQSLSNEQKTSYPIWLFELEWTGGKPVQQLHQKVAIKGTKENDIYFYIRYDPQTVGEYIATLRDHCNAPRILNTSPTGVKTCVSMNE